MYISTLKPLTLQPYPTASSSFRLLPAQGATPPPPGPMSLIRFHAGPSLEPSSAISPLQSPQYSPSHLSILGPESLYSVRSCHSSWPSL